MTCEVTTSDDGKVIAFSCSRGSRRKTNCKFCNRATERVFRCDEPLRRVKAGQTCDMPMCDRCVTVVGPDKHLCPPHRRARDQRIKDASRFDERMKDAARLDEEKAIKEFAEAVTESPYMPAAHVDEATAWLDGVAAEAESWLDEVAEPNRHAVTAKIIEGASRELGATREDLDEVDRGALAKMFPDWDVPGDPPTGMVSGPLSPERGVAFAGADAEGEIAARPGPMVKELTELAQRRPTREELEAIVDRIPFDKLDDFALGLRTALEKKHAAEDTHAKDLVDYINTAFAEPPPNAESRVAPVARDGRDGRASGADRRMMRAARERVAATKEAPVEDRGGDATVAEKVAWVRGQGQTRNHHCHWPGCETQVPPAVWGCKHHWYQLPRHLRDKVWASYRVGQETTMSPSREYVMVMHEVDAWIRKEFGAEPKAEPEGGPRFERQVRETRARDEARAREARPPAPTREERTVDGVLYGEDDVPW